jgi:hypothetical protein
MKRFAMMLWGASLLCVAGAAGAADHPGSDAKCGDCHAVGKAEAGAPAVMPEQPGFFAKLMGKQALAGHPSVSCVGVGKADGSVTGCHRPEDGRPSLLAVDLKDKPVDVLCRTCHAEQARPGSHHPSYKADKNQDGVPETIVRPAEAQEIYTQWVPSAKPAPLNRFPDALVLKAQPDGTKKLDVALPLATVAEVGPDGQPVTEANVVTCSTCHNPHFGYLVEVGSEEELNREQVAREKGDGLLRLRDYTNALCEACH